MTTTITLLGVDPAFKNVGFALAEVEIATKKITPVHVELLRTEKDGSKQVRKNSDDLRRAREITLRMRALEGKANLMAAEIPSGSQSAAAARLLGMAAGILAGHSIPLIQVQIADAKRAAVGNKNATKDMMIDWAYGNWPGLAWLKRGGRLVAANEHIADALAVLHAAVLTAEFDQAAAMFMVMHLKAAE